MDFYKSQLRKDVNPGPCTAARTCSSELRQASGLITCGVYAGREQRASNGTEEATELIFKLEKIGSGWGEELFPRLTVEQRPIKKRIRIRNRSSFPNEWQVCLASLPGALHTTLICSLMMWL